jgi:Ca2+-binding EF-hand superfamily protein
VFDISRQLDATSSGYIALDELLPYIGQDESEGETHQPPENNVWPDWLLAENQLHLMKQLLTKLVTAAEQRAVKPFEVFGIFDPTSEGLISADDFAKVLSKLCEELSADEM